MGKLVSKVKKSDNEINKVKWVVRNLLDMEQLKLHRIGSSLCFLLS